MASPDVGAVICPADMRRRALVFAMETGSLRVVRHCIERDGLDVWASLLPDGHLATWLAKAEAHETVNGPGSFLDKEHRFNVEVLPWLDRPAETPSETPRDAPAFFWSMELGWHGSEEGTSLIPSPSSGKHTMQTRDGAITVRDAGLSIYFEADALFVLVHIESLGSMTEAEKMLAARPTLAFDGDWISVLCPGRAPRRLCPTVGDEYGVWPAGTDRDSSDDYRIAQTFVSKFLAALTAEHVFQPTWYGIVEYVNDTDGRFKEITRSMSGDIDTPGRR